MDNRTIDVTSQGAEGLALALRLAWIDISDGEATHYKIISLEQTVAYYGAPTDQHRITSIESEHGTPTLILLRKAEQGALPLPYPLDIDEAIVFVAGWLRRAPLGQEPDHDGCNEPAWRVFTEQWGHVAGHHYAIVAVQPAWAMFGK
jgi:hypothetical protein